jgi:hypothetical protein
MKKNLFIARTPLQLFNCIEAKNRFHADEENILFYQYQRDIDKKQMQSLIKDEEWHKVIAYPLDWKRRLFFPLFLHRIKQDLGPEVSYCYYGAYNSIISSLINSVDPKELVIVDDGVKTLEMARLVESGKIDKKSFLKKIRNSVLSSDTAFLYRSSFFTIYDLGRYKIKNRVILNDYRIFHSSIKNLQKKDVVYFIGTNLNEKVLKDTASFEGYIKKIRAYYKGKRLIYVLHRYESPEFIRVFADRYNFEYVKFDGPIEIEIAGAGFLPVEIATFVSSAIDTLSILYPGSRYKIFYLEGKDIKESKRDIFAKLYDSFKDKGYEVIHVSGS